MSEQPIILVDASNVLQRAYHSAKVFDPEPTAEKVITLARSMVLKYVRELQGAERKTMLCAESGRSWRHDEYPAYKDGRKQKDEILSEVVATGPARLAEGTKLNLVSVAGFEADDVIATYADLLSHEFYRVIIVTGDKDLLQCLDGQVKVCLLKTTGPPKMYSAIDFRTEYGFSAPQIADYKALVGDKSDNIVGVDQIGEKTARRLLAMYGSLSKVYEIAHLAESTPTLCNEVLKPRVRDLLIAGDEIATRNMRLIVLRRDVPGVTLRSHRDTGNHDRPTAAIAQADQEREHESDQPAGGEGDMEPGGGT